MEKVFLFYIFFFSFSHSKRLMKHVNLLKCTFDETLFSSRPCFFKYILRKQLKPFEAEKKDPLNFILLRSFRNGVNRLLSFRVLKKREKNWKTQRIRKTLFFCTTFSFNYSFEREKERKREIERTNWEREERKQENCEKMKSSKRQLKL